MTTATTSLETIFADLCAKHDLTSLSVSYNPKFSWDATCHWNGHSNDGLTCATSDYRTEGHTPQSAIADALTNAAIKRTVVDSDIPALEIEQVVA